MASRGRRVAAVALRHAARAAGEARLGFVSRGERRSIAARALRSACEELGPLWVKLGQLLSVRPDLAPPEVVAELERLQDRVPPVPAEAVRAVVRSELGASPDAIFATFDPVPFAAASIAQVHRATLAAPYRPVVGPALPAGAPLAVKVVRPGLEAGVAADLGLARRWAERLERLPAVRRWRPRALVAEFEASLARELDLRHEGRVADRFARDFADDPVIAVPSVVWPHTTRRVLTTAYLEGWRLTELGPAERAGIDARALAVRGAEAFLRQVLEHGRFHADLHPANLLVTRDGRIVYLDFGIVGTTRPAQRDAIAQLLLATAVGDPERAVRASRALGLAIPAAAEDAMRRGVDALQRRHLAVGRVTPDGAPAPADLRGFALGFLRLLADQRIAMPEGYGLLVKALATVEGVARALVPDIDVLAIARPYVTRRVAAQLLRPERLRERAGAAARAFLRELLA